MLGGLNITIIFRHHWKLLFVWGFIPVGLQTLIMVFLPESTFFYVNNNRIEEARAVLERGMSVEDAALELA